ncbi:MAG: ribosome small subunit-dependent GTPase A [Cyclobacteriaceae bacterium]
MKGLVIKSTGSWYRVKTEQEIVEARLFGKFKLEDKKITNPIAVGDEVILEPNAGGTNEWMIRDILPRKNYIIRKSPRKKGHDHLIATNVDQALMIATLKMPRTSLGFIDRFLVTLEAFRIPGIIFFNKTDLLNDKDKENLLDIATRYKDIGYECAFGSVKDNQLGGVEEMLKGKVTLLSGHSGSGKSSLINVLVPGTEQKVTEVSGFANKGVHTTTFAEMFFGGDMALIDTPGIKELGLAEVAPDELGHYFPEMRALLGKCKFNNCLHVEEPGCAVKDALEAGDIYYERYISYLSMLEDEDNRR